MKKIFSILFTLSFIISISAQTSVSGNQSGTWTFANSPYQVTGQILVPSGQTLNIEAGVEIDFQGHYKFTVYGNLQAIGTEENMITFTTHNYATGWGGIRFENSASGNNLTYCRIEYGKTGTSGLEINGGGMALINSNADVDHCIFADNDATGQDDGLGGAVYLLNAGGENTTHFTNCTFLRNHAYGEGGAMKFTNDLYTEITGCTFIENDCRYGGGALAFYTVVDTKVTQCLFYDNYTSYGNGGAINTLGAGNTISFKNCTFHGNSAPGGDGGGLSIAYATVDFVNTIIRNNPGAFGDDLVVSFGGTVEVNYSNLTMPADDATGNNNIDTDPLFVDADGGDFHLMENSPCIDAGTDIGLAYAGDAPDMGCYEQNLVSITNNYQSSDFEIFPNPTSDFLNIKESKNIKSIFITDLTGKVVLVNTNITENHTQIDVGGLVEGIYLLNIVLKDETTIGEKIIIRQ